MAGLYFPLLINAEIYFCSSLDKLLNELKEVKPTIFSAVPRLYENIFKKSKKLVCSNKIKKVVFNLMLEYISNKSENKISYILGKILVKILISKKVKSIFGGRVKALISGGAALNPEIGSFFNKIGFAYYKVTDKLRLHH